MSHKPQHPHKRRYGAVYHGIDAEKARTLDETRRQVDAQVKSEARSTVPVASDTLEVKLDEKD